MAWLKKYHIADFIFLLVGEVSLREADSCVSHNPTSKHQCQSKMI